MKYKLSFFVRLLSRSVTPVKEKISLSTLYKVPFRKTLACKSILNKLSLLNKFKLIQFICLWWLLVFFAETVYLVKRYCSALFLENGNMSFVVCRNVNLRKTLMSHLFNKFYITFRNATQ